MHNTILVISNVVGDNGPDAESASEKGNLCRNRNLLDISLLKILQDITAVHSSSCCCKRETALKCLCSDFIIWKQRSHSELSFSLS